VKVYVGGFNALTDDFANLLGQRLPLFIAVVILLSFLLLMAVFRSILVPLKAAIMNLLSIGAAYGVVVMIFQYGWGKELVGVSKEGPIEAFLPIMMFAILFGLSMDYEVFLLSRIREEYLKSGDNATAVADGLSATARVITAAAAIMCTFFLSFVLGDNIIIKLFGIGFAASIFIDATLIRLVIVPSTMELLGDANWWLPGWLDRILPHLDVEGPTSTPAPTATERELADSESAA
jgi:RND superfamily putative drug exporter